MMFWHYDGISTLWRYCDVITWRHDWIVTLHSSAWLSSSYRGQDCHSRYRTEAHKDVVGRFNERWVGHIMTFWSSTFIKLMKTVKVPSHTPHASRPHASRLKSSRLTSSRPHASHLHTLPPHASSLHVTFREHANENNRTNVDHHVLYTDALNALSTEPPRRRTPYPLDHHVSYTDVLSAEKWNFFLLTHSCVDRRFILSLASCKNCMVINDKLDLLPISSHMLNITALPPKSAVRNYIKIRERTFKKKFWDTFQIANVQSLW